MTELTYELYREYCQLMLKLTGDPGSSAYATLSEADKRATLADLVRIREILAE